MNLLQNLSIKTKLILLSLVPVLGLGFYLQKNVMAELDKKRSAEELILNVTQIEKMGNLIHQLQVERSLSVTYMFIRKDRSRETMVSQRETVDQSIADLNAFLKENNLQLNNSWLLDSLPSFRIKTDQLKFSDNDNANFVNGKNRLLAEVSKLLRSSDAANVKNNLENHIRLLYTKDFLGLMRGQIAQALINGKFDEKAYGIFYDNKAYRAFAATKSNYDLFLEQLITIGEPEIIEKMKQTFDGPIAKETYAMIDSAFTDPRFKSNKAEAEKWTEVGNTTFDHWYEISTGSLNLLKQVEDFSSTLIRSKAEQEVKQANQNVMQTIMTGIIIVVIITLIAWFTILGIVNAIGEIKAAAALLATGNISEIALDVKSKDEIGDLARAFGLMIGSTREFSVVAEAIGKGDYTQTVAVRGKNDTLGIALSTMKEDLQKLAKENETRNWLLSGNSELNDKLKGEKEVMDLAQEVVTKMVTYLNAQIGAIYLKDHDQLVLAGSYAFEPRKNNANKIKHGEGLVGQAAVEKRLIVFNDVPDDYIKINSGLGYSAPHYIVVFPFIYEDDVKGVIEIGSVRSFSDLDIQLLNLVGNNIAIAFNGAQSRATMKELLEETQRQAEELQSQQEELRQSNEELLEKTDLLERSEAELKAQQEELQQTNEELEEKANLLVDQKEKLESTKLDIEKKARELEVISKYKSEFLANMSHELRTPLNSILILSQLLSENKHKRLAEKDIEFSKNIHSSGTDLLNLINEILDLSKVESGKLQLDIDEVSFKDIQSDVSSMFTEVAKNKTVEFTVTVSKDLNIIHTDRLRLQQIIRNLLSNAFKFTDKGGQVSLKISKPGRDTVFNNHRLSTVPNMISFAVKDSGIGIPLDKQGIVFEAFQQADGSTKRKYGGTGLGLSICRELAGALGGEIQLYSRPDEGSTFTLFLPQEFNGEKTIHNKKNESTEPADEERSSPLAEVNNAPLHTAVAVPTEFHASSEATDDQENIHENDKVVVIMEDDEAFARILLDFVRERNYKGIVAHQGNVGLSFARHYKPDAIILDMKLPVMDGSEVLKQLKRDPGMRHIPVQIISGFDLKKEVMELGAFDYVMKPISRESFQGAFDRIEDFVNRKIKKLLIVEDNELQNKAIRELIGSADVKCLSCYSGGEAIDLLHKEKIDCIIVDLGLPDMSGFDLLEKIKNDVAVNKIPVIVYTGRDLSKEEAQKLNRLASTVVLKTADSHERLLDETILFLHQVESKLPKEKQSIIRKLYKSDEVLKNKLVLVVDDDIRNIYSLTNVLDEEGMKCIVAENGKIALKTLDENPGIEIVLMDVMMPEMDGYEATRAIRKQKQLAGLPIIALTAKAMKGDREKCLEAGMSDYISKPVNIDQLLSLMRVWLYKK